MEKEQAGYDPMAEIRARLMLEPKRPDIPSWQRPLYTAAERRTRRKELRTTAAPIIKQAVFRQPTRTVTRSDTQAATHFDTQVATRSDIMSIVGNPAVLIGAGLVIFLIMRKK